MENFIFFLYNSLQSPYFLLSVLCIAITVKAYYIGRFIQSLGQKNVIIMPLIYLTISIASALIGDIAWFFKLLQAYLFVPIPYYALIFLVRIAWAAVTIQYYTLVRFLQTLVQSNYKKNMIHYIITALTVLCSGYFIFIAFFYPFQFLMQSERDLFLIHGKTLEFLIMQYVLPGVIGSFSLIGLYTVLTHLHKKELPKILQKQVKFFTFFFIIPYFLVESILATWFTAMNDLFIVVSCSTILLAIAVYYCLHNVLKVRFVNSSSRVHGAQKPQVIDEFKNVLRELSNATSQNEFSYITQLFFKEAFGFSIQSVHLTIREYYPQEEKLSQPIIHQHIESFIAEHEELFKPKVGKPLSLVVYDEIAFNNFYTPTSLTQLLTRFLSKHHLTLFLPIYSNKRFVGYITVAEDARNECITHSEQDALEAFATYLGNVIKLLRHRTIDTLLYKEKKLKDSLYIKHQKINHYKESVHSFLRQTKQKKIGIVLYKNGHFKRANSDARALISFDPNLEEGHPISKALKEVGRYVETFKTSYTHHTKDSAGHPLILAGVPHLKENNIIITVSYPDISDVILQQMHLLNNPNDWDYVLYLSSTKAGSLINSFIPGTGEYLLNIKIKLLKAALNKKALLLQVPEGDLLPTAQLIHDISLRESLYTLSLSTPTSLESIADTLFGTAATPGEAPLLQKISNGTLLIKEIHHLDMPTQEYFTKLITYGSYQLPNESVQTSNVRLISSSHYSLSDLVQKERFSTQLYGLLKKEIVTIPSPCEIPLKEQEELITSVADSLIHSAAIKHIFTLSEKEKQVILSMQSRSLSELKLRVEQALLKKAEDMPFGDTGLNTNGYDDPELILAARLGKQALKDEYIMTRLWEKFKNQNKIALFLGVNRSSVNRRFKAYQLGESESEQTERMA